MYVKVFSKILSSSVWSEDMPTRLTWIALLAMSDRDGFVAGSVDGLSRMANIPLPDFRAALDVLSSPDTRRPGQRYEGRRIDLLLDGILILNYPEYRAMTDPDTVREQTRERVRKHRAKTVTVGNGVTHDVTDGNAIHKAVSIKQEAVNPSLSLPTFADAWALYPKRLPSNPRKSAEKAWNARIRDGVPATTLVDSVGRYAAYAAAKKIVGTEYVLMAATFFGPDERWKEDWTPPPPKRQASSLIDEGVAAMTEFSQGGTNGKS